MAVLVFAAYGLLPCWVIALRQRLMWLGPFQRQEQSGIAVSPGLPGTAKIWRNTASCGLGLLPGGLPPGGDRSGGGLSPGSGGGFAMRAPYRPPPTFRGAQPRFGGDLLAARNDESRAAANAPPDALFNDTFRSSDARWCAPVQV